MVSSVALNRIVHGDAGDGPPLVVVHGLYGSARNWGAIAKRLSDARQVVAVDLRNHGESPHVAEHSYAAMADDLAEVVTDLGGRADLLGHSMGGKAAMALALTRPELVSALLVADIAPVAYGHSQIQYIDAMERVDLDGIARRSEADGRLAAYVDDPALRAFLLQSLVLNDGPPRWRLNLGALRSGMAEILGFPDLDGPFEGPTTFISGGASDYVTEAQHPQIRALFPAVRFDVIPGAGHWVHAEVPRPFEAAVRTALGEGS